MELRIPYKNIDQTLKGIHRQVCDSLDYCASEMPIYSDPVTMFYGFKPLIKYHNDPPGVELLQSVPTLFDRNYWGQSGAGDCDCFSILILAMCAFTMVGINSVSYYVAAQNMRLFIFLLKYIIMDPG
jgi:hypothetical protein